MSKNLIANLSLISVAIIWGITFYPVQEALKTMNVFNLLFFRFGVAGLVLLPILWHYKDKINISLFLWGSILGAIYFIAFGTQTIALLYTTSSIVAFITGLYIVIIPIILLILFREKTTSLIWIATFISIFGLWLLIKQDSGTTGSIKGYIYSIICALFFALHVVVTEKTTKNFNTIALVTIEIFVVAILSLFSSIVFEPTTIAISFNSAEIFAIVITALFATVYALFIQTYMQKFISATRLALIFMLEPIAAAILGVFWANEKLSTTQLIGALLIILAMLISELKSINTKKAQQ